MLAVDYGPDGPVDYARGARCGLRCYASVDYGPVGPVDYTRGARCGLGRCGWENKRGAEGRGVAPHVMMD